MSPTDAGAPSPTAPPPSSSTGAARRKADEFDGARVLKHFRGHGDYVGVARVQAGPPGFPFRVKCVFCFFVSARFPSLQPSLFHHLTHARAYTPHLPTLRPRYEDSDSEDMTMKECVRENERKG